MAGLQRGEDSIRGGQINNIEAPYRLLFKNYDRVNTSVKDEADHFVEVIQELSGQGGSRAHSR
jgi:hypothetical protein